MKANSAARRYKLKSIPVDQLVRVWMRAKDQQGVCKELGIEATPENRRALVRKIKYLRDKGLKLNALPTGTGLRTDIDRLNRMINQYQS